MKILQKKSLKKKKENTWSFGDLFGGIKTYLHDATSEDENDEINKEDE